MIKLLPIYFVFLFSLSSCSQKERSKRDLEFIGLPVKTESSEIGYWIFWTNKKLTTVPFIYPDDPNMQVTFFKIKDDRIVVSGGGMKEPVVYKISLEDDGIFSSIREYTYEFDLKGKKKKEIQVEVLMLNLNEKLAGKFHINPSSCWIDPYTLVDVNEK